MSEIHTAWRVVKRRYADRAFDGEGARRRGGRWASRGHRVVYASDSQALATLEVLAGLDRTRPMSHWVLFRVAFAAELVTDVRDLPDGWDAHPPGRASQAVGDAWLRDGPTPVLRVPSVIVPAGFNYVLAPDHPGFRRIRIGGPEPMRLDPRL